MERGGGGVAPVRPGAPLRGEHRRVLSHQPLRGGRRHRLEGGAGGLGAWQATGGHRPVHHIRQRLPFPLHSLHTDNGAEFINHTLYNWCRQEQISFTRGRSYRKNDQAYVEQRNWLTIRRAVGYDRLASKQAYALLGQLY